MDRVSVFLAIADNTYDRTTLTVTYTGPRRDFTWPASPTNDGYFGQWPRVRVMTLGEPKAIYDVASLSEGGYVARAWGRHFGV